MNEMKEHRKLRDSILFLKGRKQEPCHDDDVDFGTMSSNVKHNILDLGR